MNSAPSSRYRMAKDPITPTSEMALEMGCLCTTTLIAHTTAMMAKIRKRMTSISRGPGHEQAGYQQVQHSDGKERFPGEAHQLVVAEPRKSAANPDEGEQDGAGFGAEPEQRDEPALHNRQQKHPCDEQEH